MNEIRLIDANALKEDFKRRLEKAKNWKENVLNNSDNELAIRADAHIDFICEVIMTIDNAPTVELTDLQDAYEQGYAQGWKERFGEPKHFLTDEKIEQIIDLLETEWGYKGIREDIERILRGGAE